MVHEIKDSSTGKKDLQRMAEWEGQGFLGDGNFPRDGVGWIFFGVQQFFFGTFFQSVQTFQKIEKLRIFFIYVEFLLIEV